MMRARLTLLVACLLFATQASAQSFVKAFNFREFSSFVTDGTNQTYVLPGDTYPTTRNGVTFGWTVAPTGCRDRNATLDVRLAGICFGSAAGTFRVDLPGAGTYNAGLSMGDAGSPQTATHLKVWDNATLKLDIGPHDTSGNYYDATDVLRTNEADWATNNATSSVTFTSSVLLVTLEAAGASSNSVITHLSISGSPSGGAVPCVRVLFGVGCD